MTVKFIRGSRNKEIFAQITGTGKLTKKGLRQGMFKAGQTLVSAASREILKGEKTGIIYIRRDKIGRRRRHQSSAPGETHANITGKLRRSLSFQLRGTDEVEFGYGVSSGKTAPDYAVFVEFGTTKMKARPSLRNTLNAQEKNLVQHFEDEIMKGLK